MTNPQILTIIVVAIVANAALILLALISMRRSSKRGEPSGPALKPAAESIPAIALAAAAGFGTTTVDLTQTSDPTRPSFGVATTNGTMPVDGDTADEAPGDPSGLLDAPAILESPADWRRSVEAEVVRVTRYQRAATVMLVELDGFERLTDRLGEAAGARLLVSTAKTLQAQSRGADRCAQLGSGRFGILLPETDEVKAINFAERVRSECDRWLESGEVALRLAIGWATLDAAQGPTAAVEEAERRLNAERRQRASSAA